MGTSLTGNNISASYLGLLKSTDSLAISTTAKTITDGAGNDLPIKLSTNQMLFGTGTESVPALSFNANTSEGFYIPTDENIGVTIAGSEVARFNGTGLSLTSSKLTLSNDQKIRWTSDDVYIQGTTSADNIQIGVGGSTQFTFAQTTGMRLHQYGSGSITGTVTQRLGVTSTGQVVEIPIGAGALDGSGTAGKIAKFTDSDTLGDSIMSESGDQITLTAGTPSFKLSDSSSGGSTTHTLDGVNYTLSNLSTSGNIILSTNGGNIGVNTTSPSALLTVQGSGSFDTISTSNTATFGGDARLQTDLSALNKSQSAYIDIATRDTSGSEVVYNLSNIGGATFASNLNIADTKKIIFGGTAGSGNDSASISFNDSTGILNVTASSSDSHKVQICGDTIEAEEGGTATFANGATIQSALSVDSIQTIGSGTTMSLGTSAGNVMTLLNSNLGVNVTSPTTAKLVVAGDVNTFTLRVDGYDTTNQSFGARIRAGTSSSDTALLVENTSASELFKVAGDGNSTFAGDVTATSKKFISTSSSSGDYVRLYAGSGTAQWDIYGNGENLRLSENSSGGGIFQVDSGATFVGDITLSTDSDILKLGTNPFRLFTNGSLALSVSASQNATFSGDVTVSGGNLGVGLTASSFALEVETSGNNGIKVNTGSSGAEQLYMGNTGGEASIGLLSNHNLQIIQNGSIAIAIDTSKNATFAGSVTVNGAGTASSGSLSLVSSDSFIRINSTGGTTDKQKWDIRTVSASGFEALDFRTVNDANDTFSTKLSLNHSGDATFAGNILFGSSSGGGIKGDQSEGIKFLTTASNAQFIRAKSIQLSTSYSGTPPSQGILFGTDTTLFRDSADTLKTDSSFIIGNESGSQTSPETQLLFDNNNIDDGGGYNIDFKSSSNDTADRFMSRIQALRGSGATSSLGFFTETGSALTRALLLDSSQNATFAGHISLNDSGQLQLGTGNDSQIYHNGLHLFIDNSTGNSYLRNTSTSGIIIRNSNGGDIQFDNEFAGNILFNTSNIERVRLDSSGNVGVGTTSPLAKLHTSDNDGGTIYIEDANATSTYSITSFTNGAGNFSLDTRTSTGSFVATEYQISKNASGADYHRWFTQGTEKVRLDSNGRVGIGTTSPVAKIDAVNGTDNNAVATDFRFVASNRAITTERANLEIFTNDNQATDIGASLGFGGRHTDSSTNASLFATIKAGKSNSTSGNFQGYFQIGTSDSGSDISERFRIDSSGATFAGDVGLADNKKLTFGAVPDFEILHNSSTNVNHVSSLIDRQLSINANIINLTNQANDVTYLLLNSTGGVFSGNLSVNGNATIGDNFADAHVINGATNLRSNQASGLTLINKTNATAGTENVLDFRIDGSDNNEYVAGMIGSVAEGTWTGTSSTRNASLIFKSVLIGNNTEYLRLNSSGNLGLNTTTPNISGFTKAITIDSSDCGYEIASSGTIHAIFSGNSSGAGITGVGASGIRFFTSASGSTAERARITSDGRLGIGVTVPSYRLEILGDSQVVARFKASNNSTSTNNGGALIDIQNTDSTNGNQSSLIFRDSNGNGSSGIFGYHSDHSDGEGLLTFGTRDSSGSFGERVRINSSGNVSINTTTADTNFTVCGSGDGGVNPSSISANTVATFRRTGGVSHSANISIIAGTTGLSNIFFGDRDNEDVGGILYDHTNNAMRFETNTSERMRIDLNGNVGINLTAPESILHVNFTDTDTSFSGGAGGDWGSDGIRIENESNTVDTMATLQLRTGDADIHIAGIRQGTNDSDLGFFFEGAELIRITSDGDIRTSSNSHTPYIQLFNSGRTAERPGYTFNNDFNTGMFQPSGSADTIAFSTAGSERARITSGGDFVVGGTVFSEAGSFGVRPNTSNGSPQVAFARSTTTATSICMKFFDGGTNVGSISYTDSATAFNTSSDYRLKEDLKDFNALEIASKIKMYNFKWKADDSRSYGVMAHELQEVVPQAVVGEKDGENMQQVDYSKLVPILLKSIQELEARVQELEKEI